MLNLHHDKKTVRREPGRDGKIIYIIYIYMRDFSTAASKILKLSAISVYGVSGRSSKV